MSHYKKLTAHYRNIDHFSHLSAICHWDQAAMMPAGGNASRSAAMAALSLHIHQLSTSPEVGALLIEAETETLTAEEKASLREMKRAWSLSTVLPDKLVEAKSLAGSTCEHAWRTQRTTHDWHGFSKNFAEVVALSQQEAQIRADGTGLSPYDAMLDIYEPGMTCEKLDLIFDDLKSWLPELTQTVIEQQASETVISPKERYLTADQNALGMAIMKRLGFDFNHGRLDISAHPFCGGVSTDVRITTRYDESDFVQSLMGIVHETGHAKYEQGLPCHLSALPVGQARSMGIHESQSLFFEMQLGRSNAFIHQLAPLARQYFPNNNPQVFSPENLQKIYTRVKPGHIRVDADELTYPAHVMLRYEIERDLINGKISYQDIPEIWNAKMKQYLDIDTTGNFKDGCMQDIHWTDGAFGYFPSYTLGAMYAAQFMAAMRKTVDVEACLAQSDFAPISGWLAQHIWSKGSILSTDDLVRQASGDTLNPEHFKQHLIARYVK